MKTLLLLIVVSVISVQGNDSLEEYKLKVKIARDDCQANPATHVDELILKKFRRGEQVDIKLAGKHAVCMTMKMGFVDKSGKVDKDAIMNALSGIIPDQAKLRETLEKYSLEKGNIDETALAIGKYFLVQAGPSTED